MKAWTYAKGYKSAYVVLMLINLAIIYRRWGIEHEPYRVAVALLVANIVSWGALLNGSDWGFVSEVVLSIGRMLAILACAAPLWLTDLILWISPVGISVWLPLLEFSGSRNAWSWTNRLTWWTCCAVLLGLESAYFNCLIQIDSKRGSLQLVMPHRVSGDSALA